MIKIYKSFNDFKRDYPNLEILAKEMDEKPVYLLSVSLSEIPSMYSKVFHNFEKIAPDSDTVEFLHRNKNADMDVLEPYIRYDVDSKEKSLAFEMLKIMNALAPVIIVFNEIPAQYVKYVAEVLKLSLPDTIICHESGRDEKFGDDGNPAKKTDKHIFSPEEQDTLKEEMDFNDELDLEAVNEDDIYIEED